MKHPTALLILVSYACALAAPAPDHYADFQEARKMEQEGREQEAFLKFLFIPGGESAAVSLARGTAKEYLSTLRACPAALECPRALLVEADLLLATGQKQEAKKRYQNLAATGPKNNWGTDQASYYPVEPPQSYGDDQMFQGFARGQLAQPFSYGPGSHRDNWLLRRLLALDLPDDAAQEFARLWEIHRANTQPSASVTPRYDGRGQVVGEEKHLVRPAGFNSYGLQFALDYAFFLKRSGQTNQALALLLEPLRLMDMDRNPNFTHREPLPAAMGGLPVKNAPAFTHRFGFGPGTAGVSRKEYIRLAYGEFKIAGRENDLVAELQKRLEADDNRARRLLAQVRLHQGQTEAALALELDYITHGDFEPLTSAYRRGLIDEEYKKTAEAVVEFEKVLALKPTPMRLPDAEEQISEAPHMQSRPFFPGQMESMEGMPLDSIQVKDRLVRLYSALGRADKAMEIQLAQFESDERRLESLEALEQMAQRFKGANQEARFNEWARQKLASAKTPAARANLAWQQRDYAAALTNAAACSTGYYFWQGWKEKFARLGRDKEREFMQAVVKANPGDAVARLTLLDLEDRLEGTEAIAALEALLAADANAAFPHGKGVWNRTHFRNYLDLAYRLMRLYERNDQLEKLRALGLRIAKGEKPFEKYDQNLYWSLSETSMEELGNACLALAVQHAEDKPYQGELLAALKTSRWVGARAQLERRVGQASRLSPPTPPPQNATNPAAPDATGRMPVPRPSAVPARTGGTPVLRWANVPDNVQICTSHEGITCLTRDERFVYAGTPWGLTVYDFKGGPVVRLALGAAVQAMVATQQQVWIGTPAGLFRVEVGQASGLSRPTQGGEKGNDSGTSNAPEASGTAGTPVLQWTVAHHPLGNVTALALDGESLWLGMRGDIRRLNRRTLELRAFSLEDLKLPHTPDFGQIIPDGEYVWADGDGGLLRYDRAADTWSAPQNPGRRDPPHLIGFIDGKPWVDVYLDDDLRHRPARVDRKSLKLTPLLLGGNLTRDQRMVNERFAYQGKDNGRLVLRGGWRWFAVDETAGQIRCLPEDYSSGTKRISEPLPDGLLLPDGGRARVGLGKVSSEGLFVLPPSPLTPLPTDGRGEPQHVSALAWPDGLRAGYVASAWADRWPGSAVWAVVFDDAHRQEWLCTGAGLGVLQRGQHALQHFGFAEGLNCGPVMDGLEVGGKFYFAIGWEDARGGLVVYDPATSVFTTSFRSDGLDSDKVIGLAAQGGQLELRFGVEYLRDGDRGDRRYRHCRPGLFDPGTRRFTSGGQAELLTQNEAKPRERPQNLGTMPFLGGRVTKRYERAGQTWLCGERGLVILPGQEPAGPVFASLAVRVIPSVTELLRQEAARVAIPRPVPLETLRELVTSSNRYVRANALAAAMDPVLKGREEYAPAIATCAQDPYFNARATAVWLLTKLPCEASLTPLRWALDDVDPYVRTVAALALAERGERPPLLCFEEVLADRNLFSNYPFGANSSVGVQADKLRTYQALAPGADREVFELFLKYPLEADGYEPRQKVLATLGGALRKHPEAAEPLLHANQAERGAWGQVRFAQAVFKHAGKELLPALHRGLASKDRVVRSNAARGCGAIGDSSSITPLLGALDMESGLARASIVWALGELKVREAIPNLIELYTDARNAEHNRRAGAGFLAQQAMAASRAQYTALRNLDAISSDWDELKVVAMARPANPRRDEELLTADLVLEAVRKIGPGAAQEFYRALAGAKETLDRAEAAVGLAEGTATDRDKNLAILNNLRGDADPGVRIRAQVSLLLLGERRVEAGLRDRLAAGDQSEQGDILGQLARVSGQQLEFARKEIEAIAGNDRLPQFLRARASPLVTKLRSGN
jgi:HEAT repeat protein